MELINNILQPFWASKFKSNIFCGFTLAHMGNMALTRESLNGKTTSFNKEQILKINKAEDFSIFSPLQTHSNEYIEVFPNIANKGRYSKEDALEGDACVTESTNIMLLTTWADCIPVLLYSPKNNIIAAIQSGWKGTYTQIINNVVSYFNKKQTPFEHIYAAIGPGIKKCCYQVSACNRVLPSNLYLP
jgi:YfiH family protein